MTHTTPTQAQQLAQRFAAHRGALTDLYAQLSPEHGAFSPWPGAMTFTALADHLSAAALGFVGGLNGTPPSRDVTPSASLDEARARLSSSHEAVQGALACLSDEDVQRTVPAFGGRQMPISVLAGMMSDHEAHHKGQAWVMARMVGVQPPFFMRMG